MPILNPLLKDLPTQEILRYAGMRAQDEKIDKELQGAVREALLYCAPKGVWQVYPYCEPYVEGQESKYDPGSAKLCRHLQGSEQVAVLAVTVGEQVEQRIEELFRQGSYTKAVLLDAAATTATEQVADKVCAFIGDQAKKAGLHPGTRFSPGYGDWEIKEQPQVLSLSGAEQIGVGMTGSCMLLPRKSVTAIVGLKPFAPKTNLTETCANCEKIDCQLRRKKDA